MIIRLILIVIAALLGLVVVNWFWQLLRAAESGDHRQRGQWGKWGGKQGGKRAGAVPRTGEPMVQDPFCHTYLPKSSAFVVEAGGRTHYFCSRQCADKYQEQEAVAGRR